MEEQQKPFDPLEKAQEILANLPHRYPFMLIDRVIKVSEEKKTITALKNVSFNEPYFQGHFPGIPLLPGVLILESIAQAGALWANLFRKGPDLAALMSVSEAKFRRPVVPGDTLLIDVELTHLGQKGGRTSGVVTVEGELVAQAKMSFVFMKQAKSEGSTNHE